MPTIRPSAVDTYADCARRTAADYFETDIANAGFKVSEKRTGIAAAIGTALHKGGAVALTEKLEHGTAAPLSVAVDAAIFSLESQIKDGVSWDQTTPPSPGNDTAKYQVRRMTTALYEGVVPDANPILIEKRLEAKLPGEDWCISGQIDALTASPGAINDHKSGVKLRSHAGQLGSYTRLARAHGMTVEKIGINFVQRVSIKRTQPAMQRVAIELVPALNYAVGIWHRMIGDYQKFMITGDPESFPANPASMLCSPKYCRAHGSEFCKIHAREGTTEDV